MPVAVISETLRAALVAAKGSNNGEREAAYVQAAAATIGAGAHTLTVRNAAMGVLGTSTRSTVSVNISGQFKSFIIGSQTAWAWTADGTAAWVSINNTAGTEIMRWEVGAGPDQLRVAAGILQGVPVVSSALIIYAPTLDTPIVTGSEYWDVDPPNTLYAWAGNTTDLSTNIDPAGKPLMAYTDLPTGVFARRRGLEASSAAVPGTYSVVLGNDDFGYALEGDDTFVSGDPLNYKSGMTWNEFSITLGLKWAIPGGTFCNDLFVAQATTSGFGQTTPYNNVENAITWNVTYIVKTWENDLSKNYGIILLAEQNTYCYFKSRETADVPTLTINYTDGSSASFPVDADVTLAQGSDVAFGGPTLLVENGSLDRRTYLYWRLTPAAFTKTVSNANLVLKTVSHTGSFTAPTVHPMLVTRPQFAQGSPAPATGKVLTWTNGVYTGSDPSIIFATQFPGIISSASNPAWKSQVIVRALTDGQVYTIDGSYNQHGIALPATSELGLMVEYRPGPGEGPTVSPLEIVYPFATALNNWQGVDEIFIHYRMICGNNWIKTDGGKWIGVSGQLPLCGVRDYNGAPISVSGNGGAPADNTGWSARGSFERTPKGWAGYSAGNPVHGFGQYIYHMDAGSGFGEGFSWGEYPAGVIASGKVVDIDLHFKINTPNVNNGIAKAWVDDFPVSDITDLRYRPADVSPILVHPNVTNSAYNLNIACAWLSFYYGGVQAIPPGEGGHVCITDFVVSTARIGRQAR